MSAHNEIKLGAHTYTVRPQKIGYLIHRLGPNLQEALTAEIDGLDGAQLAGAKARDVLAVFIPDLMPMWEWLGYASQGAMEQAVYDESADRSPEPLEIKAAFKAASNVNGGEVLGHLKALMLSLAPQLQEKLQAVLLARWAEASQETSPTPSTSAPSSTSPPASGTSDPMTSGTSAPTPTPQASAA